MSKPPSEGKPWSVLFEQVGEAVYLLSRIMERPSASGWVITGLSIRSPEFEHGEFLVTVRALDGDGQPVVGWHSSTTLADLLRGLNARLDGDRMKWKPDERAM
jgi:hypothetical protein